MSTMKCQRCGSSRIAYVGAKCDDRFYIMIGDKDYSGEVLSGVNVGWGDYVKFGYCLDCGQMKGIFPIATTRLEE